MVALGFFKLLFLRLLISLMLVVLITTFYYLQDVVWLIAALTSDLDIYRHNISVITLGLRG
jgi:hypothetical protein